MTKQHVVHIIDRLPPDGAERLLVDVLKNRSDKFNFTVLCLIEGGELVAELEKIGVPVVIMGRKSKLDLGLILRIRKWLRQHQAAVVHTHLFTADSWGRLAAYLAGVPCIISTVHSTNTWKHGIHKFVDRLLARISTNIIACSDEVASVLIHKDGIPEKRVVVVVNGIDLLRFKNVSPVDLGGNNSLVKLVVIGRLHPAKGHDDLITAINSIKTQCSGFHFFFVGEGELRKSIEESINKYGLGNLVTLLGQRSDVPAILAAADVFVMPSRWEGLPMALLEAMAMGKAIVATRVGGIPDVITSGKTGLLINVGDGRELEESLIKIIVDKKLRENLGSSARELVQQRYSATGTSRQYEQIYQQALA
jgi:glycosyltransferase involved in cell wall biosynthesis